MRCLPALLTALLLPGPQPLLLGTLASTATLLVSQAPVPVQAQNSEAVAKIAQAITVRTEGATQGSGVLVKRDGSRYTVLTAWHVVSGQRPGEELDVYTPDGKKHSVEQGSIKRLGEVDMAVLTFTSPIFYDVARVGDVKSVSSGDQVLVAGFPSNSNGKLKYDNGKLVANAAVGIDQGYQLLYTNDTILGMSGGVVLKADGTLIGMHGRGELDEAKTRQTGLQTKTGTNQGVPISYYKQYEDGRPIVAASSQAVTNDDFLAQAYALLRKKGSEQEVVSLTNQSLAVRENALAYVYRAQAKFALGDEQGSHADSLRFFGFAYLNRGNKKLAMGDRRGAIKEYSDGIALDSKYAPLYFYRGLSRAGLGDRRGAIKDYSEAISIDPELGEAYLNRGNLKIDSGDDKGACSDYKKAASFGHEPTAQWLQTASADWCRIMP